LRAGFRARAPRWPRPGRTATGGDGETMPARWRRHRQRRPRPAPRDDAPPCPNATTRPCHSGVSPATRCPQSFEASGGRATAILAASNTALLGERQALRRVAVTVGAALSRPHARLGCITTQGGHHVGSQARSPRQGVLAASLRDHERGSFGNALCVRMSSWPRRWAVAGPCVTIGHVLHAELCRLPGLAGCRWSSTRRSVEGSPRHANAARGAPPPS
jgi:hypothetical protein